MGLIQCEACSTKFKVPDGSIPAEGKFVRCSKCDHEWLAKTQHNAADKQEQAVKEEGKAAAPSRQRKPMIRPQNNTPAISTPLFVFTSIAAVLLFMFTIYYTFVSFRHLFIDKIPVTQGIYDMLSLYDNDELKITDVKWEIQKIKDIRTRKTLYEILVYISITNISDEPRYLDMVRITGFDATTKNLGSTIMNNHNDIVPGKTQVIDGILVGPINTRYLAVDIGNESEMASRKLSNLL